MSLPPLPGSSLYEATGDIKDINTLLVNRNAMRAFYAEGVRAGAKAERERIANYIATLQMPNAINFAESIRAAAKTDQASENNAAQAPGYQYNGTQGQWGASIVGRPEYQVEQREKNRKARATLDDEAKQGGQG